MVAVLLAPLVRGEAALKDVFKDGFYVGAALNAGQFFETNQLEAALVKTHFNSITPENDLKWEHIHPAPGQFNFAPADRYVAFGEANKMFIIGHTLVWHGQTPTWVFEDEHHRLLDRAQLLARMREHILTVVGRYRGRIKGWDVVNEAVDENGSLRKTPWLKGIGEDYLVQAYQFAHEADPQAQLYYNDYGLENPVKRAGAIALVKKLQAAGVKIAGVGLQGHYRLSSKSPSATQVEQTITDFSQLGVNVMFTELDIDVLPSLRGDLNANIANRDRADERLNPFPQQLPPKVQQKLAARYAELFAVFLRHRDVIKRVTFWGVTDADSWLNDWPVTGRTSYPLLFDRAGNPKPAFDRILAVGKAARVTRADSGDLKTALNGKF